MKKPMKKTKKLAYKTINIGTLEFPMVECSIHGRYRGVKGYTGKKRTYYKCLGCEREYQRERYHKRKSKDIAKDDITNNSTQLPEIDKKPTEIVTHTLHKENVNKSNFNAIKNIENHNEAHKELMDIKGPVTINNYGTLILRSNNESVIDDTNSVGLKWYRTEHFKPEERINLILYYEYREIFRIGQMIGNQFYDANKECNSKISTPDYWAIAYTPGDDIQEPINITECITYTEEEVNDKLISMKNLIKSSIENEMISIKQSVERVKEIIPQNKNFLAVILEKSLFNITKCLSNDKILTPVEAYIENQEQAQ